jgi:dTDP-4-dehydrorhamnose 3,5-epimerase
MQKPIILNGGLAVDDRGSVTYINDLDGFKIKRFYEVRNHETGFIRAWHGHKKEAKLAKVIQGCAVLKLMEMETFNKWENLHDEASLTELDILNNIFSVVLAEERSTIVYIPPGYYNGFKTMTKDTIIQFFSSSTLKESEGDDIRVSWAKPDISIWEIPFR